MYFSCLPLHNQPTTPHHNHNHKHISISISISIYIYTSQVRITWVSRDARRPVVQWRAVGAAEAADADAAAPEKQQQLPRLKKEQQQRAVAALMGGAGAGAAGAVSSPSLLRGLGEQQGGWAGEEAAARSVTYTRADLCGAPAATVGFHDPGACVGAMDVLV